MESLAEFYKNYAVSNIESSSGSSEYLSPTPVFTHTAPSDLPEPPEARTDEMVYPDIFGMLDNALTPDPQPTAPVSSSNQELPSCRYQSNYASEFYQPAAYMKNVEPLFHQNNVCMPNPYYNSYCNQNYYMEHNSYSMVQSYAPAPEAQQPDLNLSMEIDQVKQTSPQGTVQDSSMATLDIPNTTGEILAHVSYPMQEDTPPVPATTIRTHECTICNRVFTRSSYLKQHNNAHHKKQGAFKCPKCGKRFSTEEVCKLHQLKHTGDKPFKCDECPKQYHFLKDLTRHKFVHSTNPYVCMVCGKGFARNDHFLRHYKRHTKHLMK